MAIALRAVSSAYVNNANTVTVALPAGAVAGDSVILFASHGYAPNLPAGWTSLENITQSNYNGLVCQKTLVAGDITTGTVTVTFGGAFYGHVALACMVGAYAGIRKYQSGTTSGAASRTLASDGTPTTGEYALYYGAGRCNGAISVTTGTSLASNNSVSSSFVLAGQSLAADGATSETFGYSAVPGGDYQAIIILDDVAIPTYADVATVGVEVLDNPTAQAQVATIGVEVLDQPVAQAQVALIGVEVLRAVTSVLRRRPVFLDIFAVPDAGLIIPADAIFVDGDLLYIDTDLVEIS